MMVYLQKVNDVTIVTSEKSLKIVGTLHSKHNTPSKDNPINLLSLTTIYAEMTESKIFKKDSHKKHTYTT